MNKKFKYKKSLLAAILSATLLAGCDGGGSGSSSDTPPVDSGTGSLPEVKPDPTPNPEPTPEPTPDPEPTPEPIPDPEPTPEPEPEPVPTKTGYLTTGGSQRVTGATCNGESSDGFTFKLARTLLAWRVTRQLPPSTLSQKLRVACVRLKKCRLALRTRKNWRAPMTRKAMRFRW